MMPMHTTPQKWLFQTSSEILVHRGVCTLNGRAQSHFQKFVREYRSYTTKILFKLSVNAKITFVLTSQCFKVGFQISKRSLLNGIREKSTSAQYMLLLLTRKSGGNFHPQRRLNIVYWSVVDVLRDIATSRLYFLSSPTN